MTEATEQAFGRFAADRLPARFAKFLLKRRLARGGMAEVFLATLSGAEGFEKELVVKLIRPELSADEAFVRRFVEEAKTCVRLAHPNIVSIFELGVEHAVLYMVMELVRGATLAELLAEGGPLGPEEGVYVALEVARALDHAHRRGVIHRDVTPGNVMLDEEGAVKLLDFGIAAPVQDAASSEI
ncbi:MAG: serine/threonine-protein kinase, partial [Polyangiales bacterium]